MKRLLLCTDLDRTLIPNGLQPESSMARERFKLIAGRSEIKLAYVTGRHRALIEQAIAEFDLPQPDFAIADVGTTIYRVDSSGWHRLNEWDTKIAMDWLNLSRDELVRILSVFPAMQLQEKQKQALHKLSFYVSPETDGQVLLDELNVLLRQNGIKANLIWSVDEAANLGLLDVLPARANKLHAIEFLMQQNGFRPENTMFAGDSGNDMDVLISSIPSVLVANANAEVKRQAANACKETLYIAKGDYLGMNGNYSAGIIEGAAHYWPEVEVWLDKIN